MPPRRRRRRRRANASTGLPQLPTGMPPRPDFLPMTPGYEGAQRGLNDQLLATLAQINAQRGQLPGMESMFKARQGTDVGYATKSLDESMIDRGIYDSGIRPQVQTRDIDIPAARQSQDFALDLQQMYQALAGQESGAYLNYNQGLVEALLQRAADAAQSMPLGLPQWGSNFGTPARQRPKRKKKKVKK